MNERLKVDEGSLPERHKFLTFWPLSRKLKENYLCGLCVSSKAGGEKYEEKSNG